MRFFLFLLLAHTAIANTLTEGCVNAPDGVPITNKNPARASTTCSQIQAKFEQKKALKNAAEDELDFINGGGKKNKKDEKKEEKLKQKKEKVRANE